MSAEEDTELRDLLQQTLENNGSLAKIRAQLRACVFMAFDEDEKIQAKAPLMNNKIKKHLEQPEGKLLFALVHEFLEYYNMDYTLSVYKSESYLDNGYAYSGRTKLLSQLHLDENDSIPVLLQLLKHFTTNVPTMNGLTLNGLIEEDCKNMRQLNQTFDVPGNESKNNTPRSYISDGKDDTYEGTSSIAEDSVHLKERSTISTEKCPDFDDDKSNATLNGNGSPSKLGFLEKFENISLKSDKSSNYKCKSPRSSHLEPMQSNKSHNEFVLPSLYNSNQEFSDNLDNYEEDFMSTSEVDISGEQQHQLNECNKKLLAKVRTEIAFENENAADDLELNLAVDDLLKSN